MGGSRGQSSVIGFVLVVGVAVVAITGILIYGGVALTDAASQANAEKARLSANKFHQVAGFVVGGGSESRQLDTGVPVRTDPDRGWFRVSSAGTVLVNESLGAVSFGPGDGHAVYQGSALFFPGEEGTRTRQGPQLRYRDGTFEVTILSVDGTAAGHDRVAIASDSADRVFPDPDASLTNPVESGRFTVTIGSAYYRQWGEHLAAQTGTTPRYDHEAETVSIQLVPDGQGRELEGGVLAGAPNGELVLSGGVRIDSYNSSGGADEEGAIVSTGDVVLEGGGQVDGDLVAAGDLTVQNGGHLRGDADAGGEFLATGGSLIDGDVRVAADARVDPGVNYRGTLTHGGSLTDSGNEVPDATREPVNVDVPERPSVAGHVALVRDSLRESNDNASTPSIDGGRLDCVHDVDGTGGNNQCELTSGEYYLDELTLDANEELIVDTTDGDVTIAVDGDVTLEGSGTIEVVGDGRVNVYATGSYSQTGGSTVTTPGDTAGQFWVYLEPGETATLSSGGKFVGVVYGPGGDGPGVSIEPSSGQEIYGALVGDVELVGSGARIHYDTALAGERPVEAPEGSVPVGYLRAHVVRITVDGN